MLITLMFLVAAEKSRTFSSLTYSANEQVCRSWEGAQPGSQPRLANGNIHRHHALFIRGVGRGTGILFLLSLFCEFESSLVREFELFWEFSLCQEFCKTLRNLRVPGPVVTAQGLAANRSSGGEKIALYIDCFAYSSVEIVAVVAVVVVAVVVPLSSY